MSDQPASPIEHALGELLDAEVEHWRRPLLFNTRRAADELRREVVQTTGDEEEA